MRRVVAIALVAAVLLTGCAPTYENPDDRSHARAAALDEAMKKVDPQPETMQVYGNYNAAWVNMYVGDMTAPEIRDIVEQTLQIFSESRIASLPFRMQISHNQKGPGIKSTPLAWWGYDPERTERYFTGLDVWLGVLADPQLELDDDFRVEGGYVFATIVVHDDRDIAAYRAEIVGILEDAGYVDPGIVVELAE